MLGGSFNPAHDGHLHISRLALQRLALDEVWWLVSPQNPLKPVAGMAPFAARLADAQRVAAGHRRIRVSGTEVRLGTRYTADTLAVLHRRFPRARFVWLMGGDNLAQLPHWQRWQSIFETTPIAVFDRPATASRALAGPAAQRYARRRIAPAASRRLAEMAPPAWVFFHTPLNRRSATRIRAERDRLLSQTFTGKKTDVIAIAALNHRPQRSRHPKLSQAELLRLILTTLEDGKAEDIVTIDLAGKTTIADYMVIASGRSARQVAALTEHLSEALSGHARIAVEGKAQGDWVLIDAGDVIVHLFRPEIRGYYNLEKMWGADLPEAEAARH